jgi:hypothetical protein
MLQELLQLTAAVVVLQPDVVDDPQVISWAVAGALEEFTNL